MGNEKILDNAYGYPSDYRIKPVADQLGILRAAFLNIGIGLNTRSCASDSSQAPDGPYGIFAVPKWRSIARTYTEAVEMALTLLATSRMLGDGGIVGFSDVMVAGQNGEILRSVKLVDAIERDFHTEYMLSYIAKKQPGDVMYIPANLGQPLAHEHVSAKLSEALFPPYPDQRNNSLILQGRFGLGIFEVACMLLTHKERFKPSELVVEDNSIIESLYVDCQGDSCKDSVRWMNGEGKAIEEDVTSVPFFFFDEEIGALQLCVWPHYMPNMASSMSLAILPRLR